MAKPVSARYRSDTSALVWKLAIAFAVVATLVTLLCIAWASSGDIRMS